MYHIPGRSVFKIEVDTQLRIAEKTPHFVGIKHALEDHILVTEMIQKLGPNFRIFAGLEEFIISMMAIGALGAMNALGNVAPRKIADLCNAALACDMIMARKFHFENEPLVQSFLIQERRYEAG